MLTSTFASTLLLDII